jgi:hypothetical protein
VRWIASGVVQRALQSEPSSTMSSERTSVDPIDALVDNLKKIESELREHAIYQRLKKLKNINEMMHKFNANEQWNMIYSQIKEGTEWTTNYFLEDDEREMIKGAIPAEAYARLLKREAYGKFLYEQACIAYGPDDE